MAQNVTIAGASYTDVPSIVVPKTGGGTASFVDVSPTTAVASDVASGKVFYLADGTQGVGTSSGGGGYTLNEAVMREYTGDIVLNGITRLYPYAFGRPDNAPNNTLISVTGADVTTLEDRAFGNCRSLNSVYLPNVTSVTGTAFYRTYALGVIVMPKLQTAPAYFANRSGGTSGTSTPGLILDFGLLKNIVANGFRESFGLKTLILRKANSICTLANINAFTSTRFESSGLGGTLYVPSALVSSYQSATNWSTILGYTNNQIKSIESTHTDPNAPIDLTLYYADGTPIT